MPRHHASYGALYWSDDYKHPHITVYAFETLQARNNWLKPPTATRTPFEVRNVREKIREWRKQGILYHFVGCHLLARNPAAHELRAKYAKAQALEAGIPGLWLGPPKVL